VKPATLVWSTALILLVAYVLWLSTQVREERRKVDRMVSVLKTPVEILCHTGVGPIRHVNWMRLQAPPATDAETTAIVECASGLPHLYAIIIVDQRDEERVERLRGLLPSGVTIGASFHTTGRARWERIESFGGGR